MKNEEGKRTVNEKFDYPEMRNDQWEHFPAILPTTDNHFPQKNIFNEKKND